MQQKLSSKPLKGMLDDYPSDMRKQNWVINKIKTVALLFGYCEYDAPIIEPLSIFAAKSSEELVKEQSYNFTDKGDRSVMLRPEITPSMARMISNIIKEYPQPFRWFSVPKCYRYERPQKGRLREFRQVNFDLISTGFVSTNIEIIDIIVKIMNTFNVSTSKYEIRYNDRMIVNALLKQNQFNEEETVEFFRLIDKKDKILKDDFLEILDKKFNKEKSQLIQDYLCITEYSGIRDIYKKYSIDSDDNRFNDFFEFCEFAQKKFKNVKIKYSPQTVRGLDYYTGLVFEVYDIGSDINRALFGGGRYDNLISLFSNEQVSGIGFGMGLHIFMLFLEQYNLIPQAVTTNQKNGYFCIYLDNSCLEYTDKVIDYIREKNIPVELEPSPGKIGKLLQKAEKGGYEKVLIIGNDEVEEEVCVVKNLKSGENKKIRYLDL